MYKAESTQIPLDIYLNEGRTFDSFHFGDNAELISSAQSFTHPVIFIWSESGNGRSHLLQALCNYAEEKMLGSIYLPMTELSAFGTEILQGLETLDLIVIDDVDRLIGDSKWEEALFHLYNRVRDAGNYLVFSSTLPPQSLNFILQDLSSRLNWGLIYHLLPLTESQKIEAFHLTAQLKGLVINDDVTQYILKHLPRDPHHIFSLLDQLDKLSLVAQRKITIPFVKQVMKELGELI